MTQKVSKKIQKKNLPTEKCSKSSKIPGRGVSDLFGNTKIKAAFFLKSVPYLCKHTSTSLPLPAILYQPIPTIILLTAYLCQYTSTSLPLSAYPNKPASASIPLPAYLCSHTYTSLPLQASQPSECGRQHILISIHAQTAAWQQSNENSEAMMSQKCGEWRD